MTPSTHAQPSTPAVAGDDDPAAEVVRRQRLLDVYGALLTDHQREACRLRLDEDWSFAELATAFAVSRSGAHDLVRRALAQLAHLEERLGHAAELERCAAVEKRLREQLAALGHKQEDVA